MWGLLFVVCYRGRQVLKGIEKEQWKILERHGHMLSYQYMLSSSSAPSLMLLQRHKKRHQSLAERQRKRRERQCLLSSPAEQRVAGRAVERDGRTLEEVGVDEEQPAAPQ